MQEYQSTEAAIGASRWVNEDPAKGKFDVRRTAFTAQLVEVEMRKVFERSWLYVGHESEIPNKNDFIARRVVNRPVIMTRAASGEINVLLNTCSHRGAEVCREAKGNARLFICPYHAWTFQNDGVLRGASIPEGASPGFDRSTMGLKSPARMEAYRGLVFISFDSGVPDLPTYFGNAKQYLDMILDQGEVGTEIVQGSHEYSIDANWKLLVENSIDGYHAASTHDRYFSYLRRNDGAIDFDGSRISRGLDLGDGHALMTGQARFARPVAQWSPMMGEPAKSQVEAVYARLVERFGSKRANLIAKHTRNLFIFPNLIINDVQAVTVRTFYPVRHDRMSVNSWALGPKNEPAELRKLRLDNYLTFLGPGGFATPDDVELLESCQRGFANREAEWSDISRGMGNPAQDALGEEQMRAFWRRWAQLMDDGGVDVTSGGQV